jgi:hypothetical protein
MKSCRLTNTYFNIIQCAFCTRWLDAYFYFLGLHPVASIATDLLGFRQLQLTHFECIIFYFYYIHTYVKNRQTPWPESASEHYRPSDRRLSAKLVSIFADRGCCVVSTTDPYSRILGFLDRSRYLFFRVVSQLYSRGWVGPVPDPLLLRKSGSAGNRTWTSWVCSQELWPLDHRGGLRTKYSTFKKYQLRLTEPKKVKLDAVFVRVIAEMNYISVWIARLYTSDVVGFRLRPGSRSKRMKWAVSSLYLNLGHQSHLPHFGPFVIQ